MMYAFKQIVSALATPLVIAVCVACVAALAGAFGYRRVRAWLLFGAVAIAYLGSISPIGDAMLAPLERRYPPLPQGSMASVGYVVVLGSGYSPRDGIPVTGALDAEGLVRIVEGVRVVRHSSSARLVVSGGALPARTPPALGYARLARDLGIAAPALIVLDKPLDTGSEAREVVALLGDTPFLLVTSAYHMPRAMRLMELAGARPTAAPTGQKVDPYADWTWSDLLPSSAGLSRTELALHEYLGLLATLGGAPTEPESASRAEAL